MRHTNNLRIALLNKFLSFGSIHLRIIDDGLQLSCYTTDRRLQFVINILSELTLDTYLFLLLMQHHIVFVDQSILCLSELDIQTHYRIRYFTQIILHKWFDVLDRLSPLRFRSKLSQMADIMAQPTCQCVCQY